MNRRQKRELEVADLAAAQHGVVSNRQVLDAGMTYDQISHRVRSGRWQRVHRGVYRHPGAPKTLRQKAMAACLAAPEGAVVSHLWAAALHGLIDSPPPIPEVTVRRGRSTRLAGVTVHLARHPVEDRCVVDGIPCTTVARTLIDCARDIGATRLRKLADTALQRKLVRPPQIPSAWDRARKAPGRHGERKLRRVLSRWDGAIEAGSPAEVRLRRQITEWGLPPPTCQVRVRDGDEVIARVDLGWPEARIGIEYDSEAFHGPDRWEHDEARHARIKSLGWVLLHADKADLLPGARSFRKRLQDAWLTAQGRTADEKPPVEDAGPMGHSTSGDGSADPTVARRGRGRRRQRFAKPRSKGQGRRQRRRSK